MRRRSGVLLLAGIVTVIVLAAGVSAGAAPSDTQQGQATKVEAAQGRLAELQGQTGAAYESYNNALFGLNQLDDKIASTKKSRASAQKDVDGARKSLQNQAAQMYKSGNVGFMDVIVGARSFSEFTGRLKLWIQLLEQDRARLAQVRDARDNLARKEKALESQRKQRVAALDSAVADKENATKLQSQAQAYLGSLDKNLAQAIQAEQARRADLARQAAARAAANVQAAPSVEVAQPIQVPKLDKAAPKPTSTPPPTTAISAPRATTSPEKVPASQPAPAPEKIVASGATLSPETVPTTRPAPSPRVKTDNSAAIEKANRLARLAAQQAEAKKKAADQAAARQKAAEKEAARVAAEKKANAAQAAAAEKAKRDAEAAARRAAVEKAAADRKAAEQEAAKQAAEQAAVRRDQIAARKAEAARQQTLAQQAATEQQPTTVPAPATTEATVPQETTALPGTTQAAAPPATTTEATVPTPATTPATTTEATTSPRPVTTPEATVPPPATTTEVPAPKPAPAPSSGSGSSVVAEAQTWLGVPYVWGGASRSGVDCSGLTMLVFSQFGISLPHSAAAQDGYGSPGSGAAGDLVFGDFQGTGTITHVGIAAGDGQMINAPYPGTVVRYDPIYPQYTLDYRTLL